MFSKVLIANRGEIALRLIRACQELGIRTVAVYPEADRDARHVQMADQAFSLGSGTYLQIEALLAIAHQSGAEAVHPGYGFLSENAGFALACEERGLAWIGPNPKAIALMGSKTVARKMAEEAGVPVVPGLTGSFADPAEAVAFADLHGYPCVVKAAAGGGGRGMQVVRAADEFPAALAKGMREGESYFGSGEVFVERYLTRPRHIEIQVVADRHGHCVALGERECTIQRRHQKLVEESPSVVITPELRRAMGDAAVRMARAVGYDSVGTCEFIFEDGHYYFLEMNTRIQVEHTVTEQVYGVDLVKEQIRIAAGGALSERWRNGAEPQGWAIECRINAEDPAHQFRPNPGLITRYQAPGGPGVRVDDCAYSGYRIPDLYDSLIAKVVATGADRAEAIARMKRALTEMVVEGVTTTIPLHLAILDQPEFVAGDLTTGFIGQVMTHADLEKLGSSPRAEEVGHPARGPERQFEVLVNRERFNVSVAEIGGVATLTAVKPKRPGAGKTGGTVAKAGAIAAPMHALVSRVLVAAGETVTAGQPLVVLEAMKMETEIPSPVDGTVTQVAVAPGETVEGGQTLAVVS
jgi:acetyl-CoA/propionyl-CoA carboxylase biotin carboxyl carrier protein